MGGRQLGESPPWHPYKLKPGYSRRPWAHLEWRLPPAELFLLVEAMPGASLFEGRFLPLNDRLDDCPVPSP